MSMIRTKQLVKTINPHYYGANSQNTPQIVKNIRKSGITIVKK